MHSGSNDNQLPNGGHVPSASQQLPQSPQMLSPDQYQGTPAQLHHPQGMPIPAWTMAQLQLMLASNQLPAQPYAMGTPQSSSIQPAPIPFPQQNSQQPLMITNPSLAQQGASPQLQALLQTGPQQLPVIPQGTVPTLLPVGQPSPTPMQQSPSTQSSPMAAPHMSNEASQDSHPFISNSFVEPNLMAMIHGQAMTPFDQHYYLHQVIQQQAAELRAYRMRDAQQQQSKKGRTKEPKVPVAGPQAGQRKPRGTALTKFDVRRVRIEEPDEAFDRLEASLSTNPSVKTSPPTPLNDRRVKEEEPEEEIEPDSKKPRKEPVTSPPVTLAPSTHTASASSTPPTPLNGLRMKLEEPEEEQAAVDPSVTPSLPISFNDGRAVKMEEPKEEEAPANPSAASLTSLAVRQRNIRAPSPALRSPSPLLDFGLFEEQRRYARMNMQKLTGSPTVHDANEDIERAGAEEHENPSKEKEEAQRGVDALGEALEASESDGEEREKEEEKEELEVETEQREEEEEQDNAIDASEEAGNAPDAATIADAADTLLVASRRLRLAGYHENRINPIQGNFLEMTIEKYPRMGNNTDIIISDFAESLGKTLSELLVENDYLWDSTDIINVSSDDWTECRRRMRANDDPDKMRLLRLQTFFCRSSLKSKGKLNLEPVDKLIARLDHPSSSDAVTWLESRHNNPLLFSLSSDPTQYHLYLVSRSIPINGGLRKAVLFLVAILYIFSLSIGQEGGDLVRFFYRGIDTDVDSVMKNKVRFPKVVTAALMLVGRLKKKPTKK